MADYEEHEQENEAHLAEETRAERSYRPDVDIVETDSAIVIFADMPGVSEADVDVQLEDDVLSLFAKVSLDDEADLTPVHTEYRVGNYRRRFMISAEIDPNKIEGRMSNGVLELVLAKREHVQPKRIPISSC